MNVNLTFILFFAVHILCQSVKAEVHIICNSLYSCDSSDFEAWKRAQNQDYNIDGRLSFPDWKLNCVKCRLTDNTNTSHPSNNSLKYSLGLNKFATMLEENFADFMINKPVYLSENWQKCKPNILQINEEIPDEVNWTAQGAVSLVNDQRKCVSSWAFSAVGVLEAHRVIKFNETLMTLSAQNLIDCSSTLGNDGCYGGDVINAFRYVKEKGISTDLDYPYVAQGPNECQHEENNSIENLAEDCRYVTEGDENQLKAVVSQHGPVAVFIDANEWTFRFYESGIYYDNKCCNYKHCLNHVMLVVGYGTENGTDYWLLKNSWGKDWGEQGYMRIARNLNNTCGIATAGLYLV